MFVVQRVMKAHIRIVGPFCPDGPVVRKVETGRPLLKERPSLAPMPQQPLFFLASAVGKQAVRVRLGWARVRAVQARRQCRPGVAAKHPPLPLQLQPNERPPPLGLTGLGKPPLPSLP